MTIITAGDTSDLYNQRTFRANGSTVTLKKISETDWLLFGDLAEGESGGFVSGQVFCPLSTDWESLDGVSFPIILGASISKPVEQGGSVQSRWVDFEYNGTEVIGNLPQGIPDYISSLTVTHDNEVGTFAVNIKMSADFTLPFPFYGKVRLISETSGPLPSSINSAYLEANTTTTFFMPSQVNNTIAGEGDTLCISISLAPLE